MKITQEQFNKAQKTFSKKSLSDTQKHTMLSNIYTESKVTITKPVVSPLSSYFIFFRQKAFVAVAVMVLLVSGTSYASAQSLPGDLLYGIKVNVIEPIGLAIRFSEESKNEYKISLLQKRIEELEELKQGGKLNEDSQKASSEATDKNVRDLESSAIFDEHGENVDVAEKIKVYNNLIDSEIKIETNIKINNEEKPDVNEDVGGEKIANDLDSVLDGHEDSGLDLGGDIQVNKGIEIENQDGLPLNMEGGSDIEAKIPEL